MQLLRSAAAAALLRVVVTQSVHSSPPVCCQLCTLLNSNCRSTPPSFLPPSRPPNNTKTALQDSSDLFRHDVAFCLGQRQDATAVDVLKRLVADGSQHAM